MLGQASDVKLALAFTSAADCLRCSSSKRQTRSRTAEVSAV